LNYLAHAFLSNHENDLLIGNFIADHLRGNELSVYPEGIIRGIHLHREIDSFTDQHPLFRESKRFFYEGFEKYSGILVDIYFDHLLARNFLQYSSITLHEFSQKVYDIYVAHESILPLSSARFLGYVTKNNIYTSYGKSEGIRQVLHHLSHRIGHKVKLDESYPLFLANEAELEKKFQSFFRDAITRFSKI
jgi:acyl carrier protein phosphodiesterase